MNAPDPSPVLDLIEAFRRSKTMFTALALGIFDHLHDGPSSAADLTQALDADPSATERLLDGCAALGLLEKRQGRYTNHPVAEAYLWSGSPHYLGGYIEYSDKVLYPLWGNLASAVKEGTHRWSQTFGFEGPIFNHFFRTPEAQRTFLLGMHGFGMLSSPRVVATFDLSRFHTLADLGGGTGHLAIAACELYPDLRGIVYDLPGPAAMAREQVALSPARDRIQVLEGDFFADDLPAADLYAVRPNPARLDRAENRPPAAQDHRGFAAHWRAAGSRKAAPRRRRRADPRRHAIVEHAGLHRRPGAQPV